MSPSENQPGLQLPAAAAEQLAAVPGQSPESGTKAPEQAPAPAERVSSAGQVMPTVTPAIALPTIPTSPQSDVTVTTQASSQLVADDGDLIEKEWVNKAKKIVEANRDDPYKQSEELTVVKADYMQKRYNKTVKLNK